MALPEYGEQAGLGYQALEIFARFRAEQLGDKSVDVESVEIVGETNCYVVLITPTTEDGRQDYDREALFAFPVDTPISNIFSLTGKIFHGSKEGSTVASPYGNTQKVVEIRETVNGHKHSFAVVDTKNICPLYSKEEIENMLSS